MCVCDGRGLVIQLRNILMVLPSIILRGKPDMQIIYCYVVLLGYTTATSSKQPWKHFSSTLVEGFFMNALLLILTAMSALKLLARSDPHKASGYTFKILMAVLVVPMAISSFNVFYFILRKFDFNAVFKRRHRKRIAKLTELFKSCTLLFSKLDDNQRRFLLNLNSLDEVQGVARALRLIKIDSETLSNVGDNRVRSDDDDAVADAAEYNVEPIPEENAVELESEAVSVSSFSGAGWDEEVPMEEFILRPKDFALNGKEAYLNYS
eukprot:GHVR01116863.1.p1 GENE.GHVR01116863.1~~GHVR01116863.1.p1  ORF type:complete len:265 (-),score=14.03 GHVR01116863.1:519-1313(-)